MKVLILGNGFDLDHNLPTSYRHFLSFCNAVLSRKNSDDLENYKLTCQQIKYLDIINKNREIKKNIMSFIQKNSLLFYFNSRIEKVGDNWIDFENEIRYVVNCFRNLECELEKSGESCILVTRDHCVHQILKDMNLSPCDSDKWDEINLRAIHLSLLKSLNDFTSALDYYIKTFINNTTVNGVSPDIIEFNADKVLTFNYSNTYERIYSGVTRDDKPIYAHGFAKGEPNTDSDIVLGITSNNNALNKYVEFEKYYQRITKKSGNKYSEWFSINANDSKQIDVLFFGHSLDSSDSDIITSILEHPNTKIEILYHDIYAYRRIVLNIIEIIGKEKLIDFVSGEIPKIVFKKQKKHLSDSTAGVEISKDVWRIHHLHEMRQKNIDRLFEKISKNITTNNTNYFFDQRRVISLADALFSIGYYNNDVDCFVKICDNLNYETDKNGRLIRYGFESWSNHDFMGEEIPCNTNTKCLIIKINKKNQQRYINDSKKLPLARIRKAKSYEEITKILNDLLGKEPTKKGWEELYSIINEMIGNRIFDEAVKNLDSNFDALSKRSRILHFIAVYNEENYNYQINEAMLESYVIED